MAASAVERLAEEGDPERTLAARLAPPEGRQALFALIAFNCELAKIPASVSEPMLGEIRLQWWREALDDLFDRRVARGHEVLQALAETREAAGWDRALLERMVEARRFSLEGLPTEAAAREAFLADTGGAYQRLAVAALGGRSDAAQNVAALVGWVEGAGRLIGAALAEAPEGDAGAHLRAHLAPLVKEARTKLSEARRRSAAVPRTARAPLMSVVFAEEFLAVPDVAARPAATGFGARLRFGWRMAARRF